METAYNYQAGRRIFSTNVLACHNKIRTILQAGCKGWKCNGRANDGDSDKIHGTGRLFKRVESTLSGENFVLHHLWWVSRDRLIGPRSARALPVFRKGGPFLCVMFGGTKFNDECLESLSRKHNCEVGKAASEWATELCLRKSSLFQLPITGSHW